jgi:hypothetical protein
MDKYNRRKFLVQARNLTYAGMTSWLCSCGSAFSNSDDRSGNPSLKESEDKQQIIVIGAGIAGITAAKKITDSRISGNYSRRARSHWGQDLDR